MNADEYIFSIHNPVPVPRPELNVEGLKKVYDVMWAYHYSVTGEGNGIDDNIAGQSSDEVGPSRYGIRYDELCPLLDDQKLYDTFRTLWVALGGEA